MRSTPGATLISNKLRPGDKVRFVSPESTPEQIGVLQRANILESWGLKVDYGAHVFEQYGYLAGTDEQRLSDLNTALRDPEVRAVMATRGGKGSYRIADKIDFEAVRRDPKLVIGFSDNTMLHLALWKNCRLVGMHGAIMNNSDGKFIPENLQAMKSAIMSTLPITLQSRADEETYALTTKGQASGPLVGGNLKKLGVAAGWCLPSLAGAILFIETPSVYLAEIDRIFTTLRKGGHLDGLVGVAVGQFADIERSKGWTIMDIVPAHLKELNVPILGGLPLGHGKKPLTIPFGTIANLDAGAQTLSVQAGVQ